MNLEDLILNRYFGEFFNRGDWPVAEVILTPEIRFHGGVEIAGRENYVAFVKSLRTGFPDFHADLEDLFGNGAKFAARFTLRGTHLGMFVGIPPTSRKVEVAGMDLFRVEQGRIAEIWGAVNALGLFQQLGRMPGQV